MLLIGLSKAFQTKAHDNWICNLVQDKLSAEIGNRVAQVEKQILADLGKMREDVDHKLTLQVAENKRLQHHINLQKAEMNKMKSLVEKLTERLQRVELELNG